MTRKSAMQFSAIAAASTFLLTFAGISAVIEGQTRLASSAPTPPPAAPVDLLPSNPASENLRETNDVRVYRAVKDAVVNITSTHTITGRIRTGTIYDNFPLEMFSPEDRQKLIGKAQSQSLGSGFVIHPAGYVITNEHVIEQGTDITCVFVNGGKFPATVIATDNEHDLAVLKINADPAKRFAAIPLGTSEDLMIGEPVYAIGNPLGYAGTMTRGIVSALDRSLDISKEKSYKGLIQTDASINPGNSGGPLLNAYGQVIGINSAIRADAQGIGFAIAVSNMRDLLPEFLSTEVLNHALVGFTIEEIRSHAGPSTITCAVLIKSVKPGSDADRAGIKPGDKLIEINGTRVNNIVDALVPIASAMPEQTLKLKLSRIESASARTTISATIVVAKQPPSLADDVLLNKMGIRGESVTPPVVNRFKLAVTTGVYVSEVLPRSPAADSGILPGDVIVQLGRFRVNSNEDLATVLKMVTTTVTAPFLIYRGSDNGQGLITLK